MNLCPLCCYYLVTARSLAQRVDGNAERLAVDTVAGEVEFVVQVELLLLLLVRVPSSLHLCTRDSSFRNLKSLPSVVCPLEFSQQRTDGRTSAWA